MRTGLTLSLAAPSRAALAETSVGAAHASMQPRQGAVDFWGQGGEQASGGAVSS
ncbi:MAG: hypothetical protein ACLQI7_02175 [Streptosporangiaceae bacterium]